ncbi:MAG: ribonuclease [Dorea sp.]|jgi:hypothetical protein|nr:ribonuclease [Dorea sp.]
MSMEILVQFVTYMLGAVGALAFMVSMITQVIKEMPGLKRVQTNAVALGVSLVLCPAAVVIACQYFKIVIVWYYVFASFLAAFVVYLVSTGGWERVAEMWERTKYKK